MNDTEEAIVYLEDFIGQMNEQLKKSGKVKDDDAMNRKLYKEFVKFPYLKLCSDIHSDLIVENVEEHLG